MGSGFLVSTNSGSTDLTTSWTAITLSFDIAAEPKSARPMKPGKIHAWSLELDLNTVVTAAVIYGGLTYDAACTRGIVGESALPSKITDFLGTGLKWTAGLTLGSSIEINGPAGMWVITDTTSPTLTLWLKLDAGTAKLSAYGARLQYTESPNG